MSTSDNAPRHGARPDQDMIDQARPGHGIPSQDTDAGAQSPLEPLEAQREAHSTLVGGAAVAGMATGAAVGIAVAGPVGVLVGASVGAAAGALGGALAGSSDAAPAAAAEAATADTVVPEIHLHVEDSGGKGRPVVLIHGWPLTSQSWAAQLPALQAAGYRVVNYDRRGFGRSDVPDSGYDYDALADDLQRVLAEGGLQGVTLVGFSMGGGEVARYIARHGESRVHSVVLAAAVPPCLMKTPDNPAGPLLPQIAHQQMHALLSDRTAFFDQFTRDFYSAHGVLQVTEAQRQATLALCLAAAPQAAQACMTSFSTTDFRADLTRLSVPTLVLHGDADAIVPVEGSGERTHRAVRHSQIVRVQGAPHGLNVSHAQVFNDVLLTFLKG